MAAEPVHGADLSAAGTTGPHEDEDAGHLAGRLDAAEHVPSWREALLPRSGPLYLVAVLATSLAAAATLGSAVGWSAALPAYGALGLWCGVISAGDVVTKRIPNKLNVGALVSGFVLLAVAAGGSPWGLGRAALGAIVAFAVYFALWAIAPAGLGLGDVKLAPYLGAHLAFVGWDTLGSGLVYGFLAQAAIVTLLLVTRRAGRRSHVPHGPAMCIGAIVSLAIALPSV